MPVKTNPILYWRRGSILAAAISSLLNAEVQANNATPIAQPSTHTPVHKTVRRHEGIRHIPQHTTLIGSLRDKAARNKYYFQKLEQSLMQLDIAMQHAQSLLSQADANPTQLQQAQQNLDRAMQDTSRTLNEGTELEKIQLQTIMSQRQQAMALCQNMLKAMEETRRAVLKNIK